MSLLSDQHMCKEKEGIAMPCSTCYSSLKIELYGTLVKRICMLRILSALLLLVVADTLTAVRLYSANWNDRNIAAN